jgi:hypothetical protein
MDLTNEQCSESQSPQPDSHHYMLVEALLTLGSLWLRIEMLSIVGKDKMMMDAMRCGEKSKLSSLWRNKRHLVWHDVMTAITLYS